MIKKIFFCILLNLILLLSCKKSTDNLLQIRLKNNTSSDFIYSAFANKDFGKINAGIFSEYKTFNNVIANALANIVIVKDTIYAGSRYFCGTPPLPYLNNGKYTLEIFPDSTIFSKFNAIFIKD